jgi:hypothetical protein
MVGQVHQVLGRHRSDDPRSGWISGLAESDGARHPTIGGLRIGKPMPERRPDEPQDVRTEWDQDGQYFHYLTKWMHALYQMAVRTGGDDYRRWAEELALAAHRGFRARSGPARLYWKMSIDLSYPLVTSSGHHDPLDGLITCMVLNAQRAAPALDKVIADLRRLCRGIRWATDDPLGIGGLLFDAGRLAQLLARSPTEYPADLRSQLLEDASVGLNHFKAAGALTLPASHRLPFRELGLAIGLQVLEIIRDCDPGIDALRVLDKLRPNQPMQHQIEDFWLKPQNRQSLTWTEHQDINAVMLATSLTAPGFLSIRNGAL